MYGRILYIEDNPQNMRMVRKILIAAGYEVLEAVDGLSGVTLATREHPDLILMDINLPDISGLEATRRIRSSPQLSHIPILAVTANSMAGDRETCLDAGCQDYLSKPVLKHELLKTIARLFNRIQDTPPNTTEGGYL